MPDKESAASAETQLARYFAQYEPALAKLGQALRAKLRARLPGLSEVVYVYARQESLVISYSPTGNGYDGVVTLALQPDLVKLFLSNGPQLSKADPHRLLQGTGKKVRYVVLDSAADLDRAEIEALIAAALGLAKVRVDPRRQGSLIVKAEQQEQRAARAKKKAPPAAVRKRPKPRAD